MGKKFTFTTEGIGSRGHYLAKILDGANSINKLQQTVRSSFYETKAAITILEDEKLIDNNSVGLHPNYQLTQLGKFEAQRFNTWQQRPKPTHPIIPKSSEHESRESKTAAHKVPNNHTGFVKFIPPEGNEVPEAPPEQPDPYAVTEFVAVTAVCDKKHVNPADGYMTAYNELLHEQFGHLISFKEVLARMAA